MKTLRFKVIGRLAFLVDGKHSTAAKNAFSFAKPGARYTPAHKLWLQQKALGIPEEERQGWDGRISMMKDDSIPVGLLLAEETKKDLAKAGFDVEIVSWSKRPKVVEQKGFKELDKKYSYQNFAVDNMLRSISDFGGGLVLSATGTGKTKTASQFFSHIDGKCLFIVDTIDLLYQSQKEIQMWLKKEGYDQEVGIVGNSQFNPKRITIATIQTLHKHARKKSVRDWLKTIDIILIDEIHKMMARRNFSVVNIAQPQAVIGLTATMQLKRKPIRFKCIAICGPKIFEFPLHEGVEKGVLSPGVVIQIPVDSNHAPRKQIKVRGKLVGVSDYIHEVVDNKNLHRVVVNLVKECLSQDLCVAVLVERIKHLKRLHKRLKDYDPKIFYGAIKVADRKKQLITFDKGKDNLILANQVFTKGINLKRIDVVIDCAQRGNKDDAQQKYGRAVRLHTEKAGIYYFDMFTEGKMEKAAKSRKGAFRQLKVPIKVLTTDFTRTAPWSPAEILNEADILLRDTLKKLKDKTAQGKLF